MATAQLVTLALEQKQFFDDNGYLVMEGLYDADEMAVMRREFHDLITNTDDRPKTLRYDFMEQVEGYPIDPYNPKNVRGIMDQPLASDYWFNNVTDPRIVSVFVDLFGPDIDFHNGKVRNNPPGFTNTQGWHQDWPYERHSTSDLAAAITYLDANDVDQGSTTVLPGSHKRGEWETQDGRTVADEMVAEYDPVPMIAKPGDVLFIHVMVLHTAGNNFSHTSRHKVINEYKSKAAIDQWGNRCALAGLPVARNGRPSVPQL